jgi:basic membrane protein A
MKSKFIGIAIFLVMVSLVLAACAQPAATPAATQETQAESPAAKPKILLLINGTLGDKSFFDSAARGVKQAQDEFGLDVKIIEAGYDPAKWQPALEDAAAGEDYDLMIMGNPEMAELLKEVAPRYPDKRFVIFDTSMDYENCENKCSNVYSILYKQNEGSYLAGLYAGLMTKQEMDGINPDGVIGVIGGQDIPIISDFIVGYQQGAKDAGLDPSAGVIVQYAGGWNDPAKGKEITKAMYQQGADIVFNVAGGTGIGIFQAAQEDGHFAIGVDSDQATVIEETDPDQASRILTSMLKNVDKSLYRAIKLFLEGSLPFGQTETLGVAEDGVGLAFNKFYDQYTPAEVKTRIEQAQKDLVAGKIIVDSYFK